MAIAENNAEDIFSILRKKLSYPTEKIRSDTVLKSAIAYLVEWNMQVLCLLKMVEKPAFFVALIEFGSLCKFLSDKLWVSQVYQKLLLQGWYLEINREIGFVTFGFLKLLALAYIFQLPIIRNKKKKTC